MQDRVPVNPGSVLIKPENGSASYYATLTRADNPTQEGTPLNKASLLKDETAALFGLGVDAVPDDVFGVLSRFRNSLGNEYVWAKNRTGAVGDVVGKYTTSCNETRFFSEKQNTTLYVGNSLDDFLDGNTEYVTMKPMSAEDCTTLNGKYIKIDNGSGSVNRTHIYYIHPNAEWNLRVSISGFSGYPVTQYTNLRLGEVFVGYVNSPDPNAYPVNDGYTYTALGQLGEKARIATGSYIGTGTYNTNNKNSLTFDFEPKLLIITPKATVSQLFVAVGGSAYYIWWNSGYNSGQIDYGIITWGKTVSWYSTIGAVYQFNQSGSTYQYVAIG